MVGNKVSESLNWTSFKTQLKNNYPVFFFGLFLYWCVYLVYKAFLLLLGTDTIFTTTANPNSLFLILFILELPLVYFLCVLFIYYLKRMFYPNLKLKDLFYYGLKLFIVDLIFLLLLLVFAYLFLLYDNMLFTILLIVVALFSLFFMFVSYKTIFKNNVLVSLGNTIKQLINPKAIAYYLITLISVIIVMGIFAGLVSLGVLPNMVSFLLYPLIILVVFYLSHYSVN